MKFILTGARDDLAPALALAERFTASHSSTPSLNGLRLRANAKDGISCVEATDQRMSIRSHLWGAWDEPEADCLVSTALVRAVKAMAAGEVTITKTENENKIVVSGKGRAKYEVALIDAEPAVAFPGEENLDWNGSQAVDAKDAMRVMSEAARFASKKQDNPSITGVSLRVNNDKLEIDSTDGFRLFHDVIDLPAEGFPFDEDEVLVPTSMVAEMRRVFPDGKMMLAADANLLYARSDRGDTLFAARRIGGKYPDLAQIVPTYDQLKVSVPREDLRAALGRMGALLRGKPVTLFFSGSELKLSGRSDGTAAEEYVDLTNPLEHDFTIAFNLDFLQEGITLFENDEVQIEMLTSMRPARFSDGSSDRYFMLAATRVQ